ncbi:MAG: hypothetical protein DRP87_07090 [Spirochaetes bacterium]|nr:MAG: hypothetical protein DRP87_07090 [Spirochaetota bacterium]
MIYFLLRIIVKPPIILKLSLYLIYSTVYKKITTFLAGLFFFLVINIFKKCCTDSMKHIYLLRTNENSKVLFLLFFYFNDGSDRFTCFYTDHRGILQAFARADR